MQDLNDLYYFAQVVEHGGFAPAARALGVQKSRLSRRVAVLEERLGVRLIQRSSRSFSVTDIGQEYYRQCLAMLVEAEAAQAVIDTVRSEPQGLIRMACPPGLLAYRFGEAVTHFLGSHPKVTMQVMALNRRVDLISEGFDIAVHAGMALGQPATLVTRKLGEVSQCLVAAPGLLAGRPAPETPPDLAPFPSLDFGPLHPEHPQSRHEWRLEADQGPTATVPYDPRLITDDLSALRAAALAGIGIAQLPSLMAEPDVRAGRLVELLPAWRLSNQTVHAVFPSRRGLLPSIRALLDFLAAECLPYRDGTRDSSVTSATPPAGNSSTGRSRQ